MIDSKEILAVGSIAFDSIQTPKGNKDKIIGGSATYFGVAASRYTKTSIIGVVGDDFKKDDWSIFERHNINTDSVHVLKGNTFSWGGYIIRITVIEKHYLQNLEFLKILNLL